MRKEPIIDNKSKWLLYGGIAGIIIGFLAKLLLFIGIVLLIIFLWLMIQKELDRRKEAEKKK